MKKIKTIIVIVSIVVLSVLVAYDERHSTVECTVVSVTETTVTVEAPNGHLYDYYLTVPMIGEKVKVTFDNRGTETNPYDDEIVKVTY